MQNMSIGHRLEASKVASGTVVPLCQHHADSVASALVSGKVISGLSVLDNLHHASSWDQASTLQCVDVTDRGY